MADGWNSWVGSEVDSLSDSDDATEGIPLDSGITPGTAVALGNGPQQNQQDAEEAE